MSVEAALPIFMRPLALSALDESFGDCRTGTPGDRVIGLLADLFSDGTDPMGIAKRRYAEVTDEKKEPVIVPYHESIMRHVIYPLREAKRCYVLGMPVACIAQAGLVGEMVALWRFRMLEPNVDGKVFDDKLQKLLLGREFDKLGQEQSVNVLKGLGSLTPEIEDAFTQLRNVRRKYLHFMIELTADADGDARNALDLANRLVVKTLDITTDNGRVILPPRVMKYIQDILPVSTTGEAPA